MAQMKNANPVSRLLVTTILALGMLATLPACAKPGPETPPTSKTAVDWFSIKVGDAAVQMQVVVTTEEMSKGLMGRRDLADDQGMLFVYAYPRQVSFWMRNTPTALDIGYFSGDGVLREVYPLFPFDEKSVPSRRDDLQFALEVKQGGFEALGIRPGAKLDRAAVQAALTERGFNLSAFDGLELDLAR